VPKLVPKKQSADQQPDFLPKLHRLASIVADFKALNVKAYDVRGLTLVTDCFLMCTASSERQLKAIANGIREGMKEIGESPAASEGSSESSWILLDYGDVIVHIFREEAREFYDLDGLWGDAEPVALDLD
jgi:ribosome-associated protein